MSASGTTSRCMFITLPRSLSSVRSLTNRAPRSYVFCYPEHVPVIIPFLQVICMLCCRSFLARFILAHRHVGNVSHLTSWLRSSHADFYLQVPSHPSSVFDRYVHDISDIFIDLLKMGNFLKMEGYRGLFISELAYVFAVVAWLYYRMFQFPFRVIHTAFVVSSRIVSVAPRLDDGLLELFPPDVPFWQPANLLLGVLQLLHIYWFYLLAMVGYRIVTESARQASRAEYEGDSDDDDDGAQVELRGGVR
jgi:hypothetical protein